MSLADSVESGIRAYDDMHGDCERQNAHLEAACAAYRAVLETYVMAGEIWGQTHQCTARVGTRASDESAAADLRLLAARDAGRAALTSDAGATVQRVVEAATRMANHDYGGHSIPFGILGELRHALAALEND